MGTEDSNEPLGPFSFKPPRRPIFNVCGTILWAGDAEDRSGRNHAEHELVCLFLTGCLQSLMPWPPCHEEPHCEVWAKTNLLLFHCFHLGCLWSHTGLWVQISVVLFGWWAAEQVNSTLKSWFSPCQWNLVGWRCSSMVEHSPGACDALIQPLPLDKGSIKP